MSADCIFCKITAGEIPAAKVYEDDNFIAFMDIFPIARGHTLVIPKIHCENALDTPLSISEKLYPLVIKIAGGIKKSFNADGINIIQNNGAAAGQEVFHSHIHIIPRYSNDELKISPPRRLKLSSEDISSDAQKIKDTMGDK